MIVTVTPNASIDKTYVIKGFGVDRINRPSELYSNPGGKGINVSRVLKELGRGSIATGFVGGNAGESIVKGLDKECVEHDFVRIQQESRLCIKVMDPDNGTQTEINESGPTISQDDTRKLLEKIKQLMVGADAITFCGNCPPGVPADFYAEAIKIAKSAGVRAVLDASGDYLREAVKASPYMITPNIAELSELAGTELCTLEEITRAAKSMKQFGVKIISVTMGKSGAIVTDGVNTWQATPPKIEYASAVGSGDAFLAAFIDSFMRGESLDKALLWGTSAGTANAATYRAGFLSKSSIISVRQETILTRID